MLTTLLYLLFCTLKIMMGRKQTQQIMKTDNPLAFANDLNKMY